MYNTTVAFFESHDIVLEQVVAELYFYDPHLFVTLIVDMMFDFHGIIELIIRPEEIIVECNCPLAELDCQ